MPMIYSLVHGSEYDVRYYQNIYQHMGETFQEHIPI
jgi:hypothetical protein